MIILNAITYFFIIICLNQAPKEKYNRSPLLIKTRKNYILND